MTQLTLLHTNDLHGRLGQLTRIAAQVKRIKEENAANGGYTIYLDAGDSEDTILLESSLTKGTVMGSILRAAGCDVMTLGNAIPLRYGTEVLRSEAENFGQPILCANLFNGDGSRIAGLEPWRMLHFGNLKAAVIGLTVPIKSYPLFFGLKMLPPLDVMADLVRTARAEGAQLVIALTHIASHQDAKLAEAVPGIHVIIGGHDHQAITTPQQVRGCLIAQAGEHGKYLGKIDLKIDDATGGIVSSAGELIPITDEMPEDPETLEAIVQAKKQADAMMANVIGRVEFPIELAFDRECAAGDLLADALLPRFADTQFSLVLAGQWNNGLPAGDISAGALFSANRSTANPARALLTGSQVMTFLKNALKSDNAARELHALRGGKVGWPHVSGLELTWNGYNVESLQAYYDGEPIQPDKTYIIASTDMEFSEFIGYLVLPEDAVSYETPTIMPEVLQDLIRAKTPLKALPGERIRTNQ